MPTQKIHTGKGSEGLGESREVLSRDFVPCPAKLKIVTIII